MPLLDHFHAPLYPTHRWESFHARWAVAISDALNDTLPSRFFAETQVHLGARIEADVVEFEQSTHANGIAGGIATATYAPPRPILTFTGPVEDDVTIEVRDRDRDARVAAIIELVSPRNKDPEEARRGFAAKMVSYLRIGAGLIAIDVVTNRSGTPHDELVTILNLPENCRLDTPTGLSAVAYQPVQPGIESTVQVWFEPVTLGTSLPTMPLAVRGLGLIPVELDTTYTEACQRSRLV
jgi:hypothetical protein